MKHIKCENRNGHVIIPVPESYSDCVTLIRSDFFRHTGKNYSIFLMLCKVFSSHVLKFQVY